MPAFFNLHLGEDRVNTPEIENYMADTLAKEQINFFNQIVNSIRDMAGQKQSLVLTFLTIFGGFHA